MENLENVIVKDPNQLDLFEGIVLTDDQQIMVNTFIERQKANSFVMENKSKQLENMLIEAGFIKGVHYQNTFKSSIETREVTLGYTWDKTQFKTEVTAVFYEGQVNLIAKRFDESSKKLVEMTCSVDAQKDKVQACNIQEQYRYVKPKTLLEKLIQFNTKHEHYLNQHIKQNELLINIVEKYTQLYPNASITTSKDWTKYLGSFEVVTIGFESGSYISFRVDIYYGKEVMYKKYDVEYNALSTEELLDKFSKQIKKEGSN